MHCCTLRLTIPSFCVHPCNICSPVQVSLYGITMLHPLYACNSKMRLLQAVILAQHKAALDLHAIPCSNCLICSACSVLLLSCWHCSFLQVSLYGITTLRYISAAYFALEALVINEFGGTQISCETGLDSGTRVLLDNLFTSASAGQRAALRQMEKPQPG